MNIDILDLIKVGELVSALTMLAIIVLSFLSVFWHVKFLLKTKWDYYSSLNLYTAIVGIAFIVVYGLLLVRYLTGNPIDISIYGGLFIRPVVLLQAGASASCGRAKMVSLEKNGGEYWRLKERRVDKQHE